MSSVQLTDEQLQKVYTWVDEVPLSRPKRNISRDFSDGVLSAELCHHYFPKLVELHNYSPANGVQQKMYNWNTLNQKVFQKLGFQMSKQQMTDIVNSQPGEIERMLSVLQRKMAIYLSKQRPRSARSQREQPQQSAAAPQPQANTSWQSHHGNKQGDCRSEASLLQREVDTEILVDKEQTIQELRETVDILELKVKKLEQLVRLKDSKIQTLMTKLQHFG